MCEAAHIDRLELIANPHRPLTQAARDAFLAFVTRRLNREPVTRILGRRGFWDFDLEVAPGVLDPRADSETLVRAAVELLGKRRTDPLQILDIGCGSGALICALLREFPHAIGTAIDISEAACGLTRRNAVTTQTAERLQILVGSWNDAAQGPFDLIVSNPPYIPARHLENLDPEVRDWDPHLALDGGKDGLDAYRDLASLLPSRLVPGGWCILEIGFDQAASVPEILRLGGFEEIRTFKDLSGHVRVIGAKP